MSVAKTATSITPPPSSGPPGPARSAVPPAAAPEGGGVTIKVLLFAQLRDRFGADELAVALPQEATGADLLSWLGGRNPNVAGLLGVSRLAVNCEYVSQDHTLQDADEVVVIPPVSGG